MSTYSNSTEKLLFEGSDKQKNPLSVNHKDQKNFTNPENTNKIYGGVSSTLELPQTPYKSAPVFQSPQFTEDTQNWSSSVQNLLDQPPASLPQKFIMGGMVFCIAFGAWAWLGTLEEVGTAQGKLVPEGETFKIQPVELGKVIDIAVEEGQEVKAGQLLVELDTELVQKEINRYQEMIRVYKTELGQKQTLQQRIQLEAKTDAAIASAELEAQQAAIAHTREKITTVRQLLAQQRTEAAAYQLRQKQLQPLDTIAQRRLNQLQAEKTAQQERINRLKPLEEEGAISREYIYEAEQALRNTEQRLTSSRLQEVTQANEQMFQADQALRDLQSRITENQGELFVAQTTVEKSQAELTQKKAQAQRKQLEAIQRIQQLDVEMTQLKGKIAESRNLLIVAQSKLQHSYLKAPISGTVLSLDLKNIGEVVEAGETVVEIAPHNVPLVVSAVLPDEEAGFVKLGMDAQVKLDAYPYQDYGVITGQVTAISADAESDEKLGEIYRVEIELEQDHILKNQEVIAFKPGQTVTADIIVRRRRIIDVLLDPIKKMQKDGLNL
ncbi:HlyD family efflux transporter periplasmic adaptor subunit [Crocosphaera sp. Alani8]|uniref:HlyD family efflux transporter periplasmic adaptor subunit n=1 Tax=Crocosphaera sp. Alani8 TaxID=3038952 RepID=UPI00313C7533